MKKRLHIIFILSAIILIPVLLGLTPIKFIQKLGSGCPFNQNKVSLNCNPCIYHSVTSQYHTDIDNVYTSALPSTHTIFQSYQSQTVEKVFLIATKDSNPLIEAPPLRC